MNIETIMTQFQVIFIKCAILLILLRLRLFTFETTVVAAMTQKFDKGKIGCILIWQNVSLRIFAPYWCFVPIRSLNRPLYRQSHY